MGNFKFEIQNCIETTVQAKSKEEARVKLIDNLENYAQEMVDGSCYVSDGEFIEDG